MSRAAYIRPSSAATWVVCTGSIDMRAMFPAAPDEADSEVTEDGTACHWLVAEIWAGRYQKEGSLAPNGRVLTFEMFDAVDIYLDLLRSWSPYEAVVEQPVSMDWLQPGVSGTPDAWCYDSSSNTIRVADLKFGFRFVEVWENWQLICYAYTLAWHYGLKEDTKIELTIVQPRSYHREGSVRTWRTTLRAIMPFVSQLIAAASAPTRYFPNPGCGDCPGRHICTAYQNASYRALEVAYGGGTTHELSPAALGVELSVLKDAVRKLEGRISGLEVQADAIIQSGGTIPGWRMVPTFSRETWKPGSEDEVLRLANEFYGVTVTKPAKLVTPAQARKVLPTFLVDQHSHKPSTGVRLTKTDPYEAQKVFDK